MQKMFSALVSVFNISTPRKEGNYQLPDDIYANPWMNSDFIKGNPYFNANGKLNVSNSFLVDRFLQGSEQERMAAETAIHFVHGNKIYVTLQREYESVNQSYIFNAVDITLSKLPKILPDYKRGRPLVPWLKKIAENHLIDTLRIKNPARITEVSVGEPPPVVSVESPADDAKAIHEFIDEFWDTLGDGHRLTYKVSLLAYWDLEKEMHEIGLIKKRSHYKNDSVDRILKRINKVRKRLQEKESEVTRKITKKENSIRISSIRITRLEAKRSEIAKLRNESELESKELREIDDEINKLQYSREISLEKLREIKPVVKASYFEIAYILGESPTAIGPRLTRIKKEIEKFRHEHSQDF